MVRSEHARWERINNQVQKASHTVSEKLVPVATITMGANHHIEVELSVCATNRITGMEYLSIVHNTTSRKETCAERF